MKHPPTTPRTSENPGNLTIVSLGEKCGRCVIQAFQEKLTFSDFTHIYYYISVI